MSIRAFLSTRTFPLPKTLSSTLPRLISTTTATTPPRPPPRLPRYIPSQLDSVENPECYHPCGLPPLSIHDALHNGPHRYKILHKLGFGGSSTVWLARDSEGGRLVTIKAMRADVLAGPKTIDDLPDVRIPNLLHATSVSKHLLTPLSAFTHLTPNGLHPFLVFPFFGPSVQAMYDTPGRVRGSRRLRGEVARRVSREVGGAVGGMHRVGVVHGDITTSNILFRLSTQIKSWSDTYINAYFGPPETEPVRLRRPDEPLGPHVPPELVAPIPDSLMRDLMYVQESVVLSDFGQSYVGVPPKDYQPGTSLNYLAPETYFDGRTGLGTDIWALGCAIFESRAGFPLFEAFLGGTGDVAREWVEVFGEMPEPWWDALEERRGWDGVEVVPGTSSIRERLREIGTMDESDGYEGRMMEVPGTRLEEDEVELLGDLLEGMVRYRPEERLEIREVLEHPWFEFGM
ncbi:kinase-like protein [Stereum hirsutum FP-91666 SS1]|uniref:kinase-like protein n=1 Tax=Stereum hirsutum (strain FP-91666) TaxID=721885 RepID=UPI000440DD97|nr:kinase-like protein [Stereum hirsutum FP-91666 SS1]EIM91661.1 kinase-like protein [Stereum hirsutum FP-91666 SS1]